MQVKNILIIQTAFIGDVILATPLIENVYALLPEAHIDVVVNQNAVSLLQQHPKLRRTYGWDKKKRKYADLLPLIKTFRRNRYDLVINCHRFGTSGLLTACSGGKVKVGFRKNPFSFAYDFKVDHHFAEGIHEVDRNLSLLSAFFRQAAPAQWQRRPRLYPSPEDQERVQGYQASPYLCIAPTSVWHTKQFPAEQWVRLIEALPTDCAIYLLGSKADIPHGERIRRAACRPVHNIAGELTLLQSAELMRGATINYVNDSAPLHLASATNAPVCAVYCSTVPAFGFYPLSDVSWVVEVPEPLDCRPCGIHGHRACPEGHFRCAHDIATPQLLRVYQEALTC